MDTDHKCIEQLQEIGRELAQKNLVLGAAGNISVQSDEGDLYVTARGSRLGELRAEDVVKISPDGKWAPGREPPRNT
jgi:ribulose-5-phosphate 4-epimerase/fuculose-1-phosphate aldolase